VNGLGWSYHATIRPSFNPATSPSLTSTKYRADAVVVFSTAGTAVLAMVVEVQLHRDPGKRWS